MKVVSIVGARPQFVKAAVVSRALRAQEGAREFLVHTGQHFDDNMSGVFFRELGLPAPDIHLGIGGGSHGQNTGRMIEAIERVLVDIRPDWVVVYGDTDTTLAGALAAAKLHQPVAHVEAGLRSFNRRMPEEINRVLTDHVSELLFAPNATAVANLQREGLPAERIREVGDVMYDAVLLFADAARTRAGLLTSLRLEPRRYVLATVHRAENTDDRSRLEAILGSLDAVASSGTPVVVPLHPRTRAAIRRWALDGLCRRLVVLDPIGYLEMLVLEQHAAVIATDSGGVQKEAYFFRVPCVTLRDETEWVELVDTGWNRLASPDLSPREIATRILAAIGRRGREGELYGEGRAASQIALTIAKTAP